MKYFGQFYGPLIFLGRRYFYRATFESYGLEIGHLAAVITEVRVWGRGTASGFLRWSVYEIDFDSTWKRETRY